MRTSDGKKLALLLNHLGLGNCLEQSRGSASAGIDRPALNPAALRSNCSQSKPPGIARHPSASGQLGRVHPIPAELSKHASQHLPGRSAEENPAPSSHPTATSEPPVPSSHVSALLQSPSSKRVSGDAISTCSQAAAKALPGRAQQSPTPADVAGHGFSPHASSPAQQQADKGRSISRTAPQGKQTIPDQSPLPRSRINASPAVSPTPSGLWPSHPLEIPHEDPISIYQNHPLASDSSWTEVHPRCPSLCRNLK